MFCIRLPLLSVSTLYSNIALILLLVFKCNYMTDHMLLKPEDLIVPVSVVLLVSSSDYFKDSSSLWHASRIILVSPSAYLVLHPWSNFQIFSGSG